MKHQAITQLVGISANTLRTYLREYQRGGTERLKEIRFYRPSSALILHTQSIEAHFRKHPPISINAAIASIEDAHRHPPLSDPSEAIFETLGHETSEGWRFPSQSRPRSPGNL